MAAVSLPQTFPLLPRLERIHMKTAMRRLVLLGLGLGLLGLVLGGEPLAAQTLQGVLRGRVLDHSTQQPLAGAQVRLQTTQPPRAVLADEAGYFRFEGVPVGRHELLVELKGYHGFARSGIMVTSAKEAVINLPLEPTLYDLDEVELLPDRPRGTPNNDMASVSALSFEVEEARKFAGGLDDPTRVAANFPGIVATPFISENFISVRGNSNRGLLYQVEGIPIPNPNHFARIGSSGGTFTIFSNQVLANSDFFVGAFPAEYGDATAGVFDVQFRNGNQERREYALQLGVLGLDLAAEGPFQAGGKASYLVNARYQTLDLVNRVINYLSLPTYHDLSFKLHLPTERAGTFEVFGIGGLSDRLRQEERDPSAWEEDLDRFRLTLESDLATVGATHTLLIGSRAVLRTALVGSYTRQLDNKQYLEFEGADSLDLFLRQREVNQYQSMPITLHSSLKHRFSPRLTLKVGGMLTQTAHDYLSQDYDYVDSLLFTQGQAKGQTRTAQAYAQTQWKPTSFLTVNAGLHYLHFDLTQSQSLEPRLGLRWRVSPRQVLSLGYGLHSRAEHWATYQTQVEGASGGLDRPNLDLGLIRAHHLVLGYQALLTAQMRLRSELYYQSLFDVPVEPGGTYSVLNIDELNQLRVLVNEGEGRNYGLDLGLERFSHRGLYYMLNASFYNSTYTDAQGRRYSTAYNGGYKVNLLMGKELRVGKKKGGNHLLGLNGALSLIGGQRYTPLDLAASRQARETRLDETRPYTERNPPLFIFDFTLNWTRNHPNYTGIWSMQIKNLFSSTVPEYREYDATLDQEVFLAGASVLPIMSYKVEF